ncbi:MAG: hypothetical protein P8J59_05305 [Phycisphaerales bacterium]|jgi:hypothetical protein|nr:hypothetical protein [Phycisphaerales bacterium]
MRIERPRAVGEDLRPTRPQSGGMSHGCDAAAPPASDLIEDRPSALDAQLLRILRDQLASDAPAAAIGGEVLRLASLAAAMHRGMVDFGATGALIATNLPSEAGFSSPEDLETPR